MSASSWRQSNRIRAAAWDRLAYPTSTERVFIGDGGGGIYIPDTDLVLVRLGALDGPVRVAHNLGRRLDLVEGDPYDAELTDDRPPCGLLLLSGAGVCCDPVLTPRTEVFIELAGYNGVAGFSWFWVRPDNTWVNIGLPPGQVSSSGGQDGIVRGRSLYVSYQPNGTLDRFGKIYKYNMDTMSWTTLITYPTVAGLPPATRLQPNFFFIDRDNIIWIVTESFTAPSSRKYLFTLGLDDVLTYVSSNDPDSGYTFQFPTQIGDPGQVAVPGSDKRIIAYMQQAFPSLDWSFKNIETTNGPIVITTTQAPSQGWNIRTEWDCAQNTLWMYNASYRMDGNVFPTTATLASTYDLSITPPGFDVDFQQMQGLYRWNGKVYGFRRDRHQNLIDGDTLNLWSAPIFYEGSKNWSSSEDSYTFGELLPGGGFRGIWGFSGRDPDSPFDATLPQAMEGSGNYYFFNIWTERGVVEAGAYYVDLDTDTVFPFINHSVLTHSNPGGGNIITEYMQGEGVL